MIHTHTRTHVHHTPVQTHTNTNTHTGHNDVHITHQLLVVQWTLLCYCESMMVHISNFLSLSSLHLSYLSSLLFLYLPFLPPFSPSLLFVVLLSHSSGSLACQALQSLFACLFDAFVYLSSFSLSSVFCIWSLSLCFLSHLPYFLSTTTTDFRLYVHRACTHLDKCAHTHTPTHTHTHTHEQKCMCI